MLTNKIFNASALVLNRCFIVVDVYVSKYVQS
jgi:hypothetical protein